MRYEDQLLDLIEYNETIRETLATFTAHTYA